MPRGYGSSQVVVNRTGENEPSQDGRRQEWEGHFKARTVSADGAVAAENWQQLKGDAQRAAFCICIFGHKMLQPKGNNDFLKEDGASLVSLGSDGAEIVAPGIISPTTQISFRGGDGQLGQLFLLRLSGTLIAVCASSEKVERVTYGFESQRCAKPLSHNRPAAAETGEARSGLRLAPKDDAAAELQLRRNWIARGRMTPVSAPCKFTMRCVLFLLEMETVDPIKPLRTLCNVDEDNRASMREAINEENP
uniref:Uncharacterized protein n=1 Tax=Ascaris lumbricoides TaxID=6252 RepID=A0A9J2P2M6_ASCLU